MSTPSNFLPQGGTPVWISFATDANGQEGLAFKIQADGQYETATTVTAADCFCIGVNTEGSDGDGWGYFEQGIVIVRIGATTAEGDFLTVAADFRMDPSTTATNIIVARALEGGVDGDFIRVKSMLPGVEYSILDGS